MLLLNLTHLFPTQFNLSFPMDFVYSFSKLILYISYFTPTPSPLPSRIFLYYSILPFTSSRLFPTSIVSPENIMHYGISPYISLDNSLINPGKQVRTQRQTLVHSYADIKILSFSLKLLTFVFTTSHISSITLTYTFTLGNPFFINAHIKIFLGALSEN